MGFQTGGAAQELFAVKADMVLKLPDAVPLEQAAMIDTAKAIAVQASHPGTAWDYLFHRPTQPGPQTLPYQNNPRVATLAEIDTMLARCYDRN